MRPELFRLRRADFAASSRLFQSCAVDGFPIPFMPINGSSLVARGLSSTSAYERASSPLILE